MLSVKCIVVNALLIAGILRVGGERRMVFWKWMERRNTKEPVEVIGKKGEERENEEMVMHSSIALPYPFHIL